MRTIDKQKLSVDGKRQVVMVPAGYRFLGLGVEGGCPFFYYDYEQGKDEKIDVMFYHLKIIDDVPDNLIFSGRLPIGVHNWFFYRDA